jgi:hypothetical protein
MLNNDETEELSGSNIIRKQTPNEATVVHIMQVSMKLILPHYAS